MAAFPPTPQQQAFLDALTGTDDNLALVARAGCGKTSTILMGVDAVRAAQPRAEVLVCAFNKAIADEVGAKLKAGGHADWKLTQASTLHSMGFGLLKFLFQPKIDDKKTFNIVDALVEKAAHQVAPVTNQRVVDALTEYRQQVVSLVGYAKGAGFGFFSHRSIDNVAAWHELADHYDVNGLDDTSDAEAVVGAAQRVYRAGLQQTDVIDFDDMILLPLVKNLRVKFGKDFIFLDEAQDLSPARQALARKFLKPGGRMIVVGDDRQAIYGFSGADADALPNLITGLGAVVLPLSVTWRCPRAVVEVAKGWVPDIEAAPSAPEGVVRSLGRKEMQEEVGSADAILCRNTAPLVELAYGLIRAGKPAKVEGREIGAGLIALAQRWKVQTVDALLTRLEDFRHREMQKAMAKNNEQKAQEVDDRVETLVQVCTACIQRGRQRVSDVVEFINDLFADGAEGATILATYHRSKGREWPRVYLFEHNERCPSRAARQPWQLEQEDNLAYVAVTRAQRELIWVE